MKEIGGAIGSDSRAATLRATALHREAERPLRHRPALLRPFSSAETVFSNGWLVLADEVVWGSLRVHDGEIVSIDSGVSRVPGAVDLGGDFLLPGLVDLHTDNLERHLQPRPGVAWPTAAALLAHDRQMAAAGVTTVFDSLCVGDQFEGRTGREDALVEAISAIEAAQRDNLLACDHVLHLRCEVSSAGTAAAFAACAKHPLVRLASLMDHTPGQRQWRRLDRWRQVNGERVLSNTNLDVLLAQRQAQQQAYAPDTRCQIIALAREQGLALASHDDTTEEHVEEAATDGVSICEFPTTAVAAAAARRRRLAIVMGAPNIVLGGSHSGNVSARDLAAVGLVDGLASDYVPASILQSCFVLHDVHGVPLADAVAMATRKPAAMVGFDDRGEIAVGKRADLVWVRRHSKLPVVRGGWCRGRPTI